MPIHLHLANLIFDKETLHKKYPGGLKQFRIDCGFDQIEYAEEDFYLCLLPAMNVEDLNLKPFIDKGLHWDVENKRSDDFVIFSPYGGLEWECDWVNANNKDYPAVAWHQKTDPRIIQKAKDVCQMPMDQIQALVDERGGNMIDLIHSIEN